MTMTSSKQRRAHAVLLHVKWRAASVEEDQDEIDWPCLQQGMQQSVKKEDQSCPTGRLSVEELGSRLRENFETPMSGLVRTVLEGNKTQLDLRLSTTVGNSACQESFCSQRSWLRAWICQLQRVEVKHGLPASLFELPLLDCLDSEYGRSGNAV